MVEVAAPAEGVVVLTVDVDDVDEAAWAFEVVDDAVEVVLVFEEELDDEGFAGFDCAPGIVQARS